MARRKNKYVVRKLTKILTKSTKIHKNQFQATKEEGKMTSMFPILGSSRFGKNLKINQTHGHEPQSESRHQASKQNQTDNYQYVYEEFRFTTTILHRHQFPPPSPPPPTPPSSSSNLTTKP